MTLQNRVGPDGAIVAVRERGLLMGNRGGRLHDAERRLGRRRWAGHSWISCRLEFRGRRRQVMAPHAYTELFFLDDLVALAAGHRPCGTCRRSELAAFRRHWPQTLAELGAIDRSLHAARTAPRPLLPLADIADGAFVRWPEASPHLVWRGALRPFAFGGYGAPVAMQEAPPEVEVLTPAPVLVVLTQGYRPTVLHPSLEHG